MIRFILSLFAPFRWFIEKMSADYNQFIRILQLKLTIDDRRINRYSKKAGNAQTGTIIKQSFFQIFIGIFFSFILFIIKSPFAFYFLAHIFVMVLMAMMIISEFSTILFDTSENVIIQPLPIKGNTVSLARNAHIFIYLTLMALSISVIPIITAFVKFGIASGLLFIFTIFLNVLFTLFLANVLYLGIMRLVSGEKLKNLLMYFQVFIAIFFMAAYQIGLKMIDKTEILNMQLAVHWYTYLFPPAFFSGLIEALSTGNFDLSHILFMAEAVIIPPIAIFLTGRYLTPIFNEKLMDLEQGDKADKVRIEKTGKSLYYNLFETIFTYNAEERAAFKMMWKMTGRERQFKQTFLPALGYIIIMIIAPNIGKKGNFHEFLTGYNYIVILYTFMIVAITICSSLLIGSYKSTVWIYKTLPIESPANFFKGTIKATFAKFFIPFYLIIGILICTLWGIKALPDIFIAFILIYFVTSLYYYIQQPFFPFSMEKAAIQGGSNAIKVLGLMLLAAMLGYFHYFLIKQTGLASLMLIPVYLSGIFYINRIWVFKRITWKLVDKVNAY